MRAGAFLLSFVLLLPLSGGRLLAELSPAQVYRATGDSVVLILAIHTDGSRSKGAGSVIAPGRVLTNAHVVLDSSGRQPQRLLVFLRADNLNDDSRRVYMKGRAGRVVRSDRGLDLALLEVEDIERVKPLHFGDSSRVSIGDPVLAIGHPENGGLWSLTSGRIGARIRNHGQIMGRHVFQTETSLNRGNSGGPLLNYGGQMIGVNTSIARKSADGMAITGVNFSVQSNVVRDWLKQGGVQIAAHAAALPGGTIQAGIRRTDEMQQPSTTATREHRQPAFPLPPLRTIPRPEDGLLTPPRPFKDSGLFDSMLVMQEEAFDRMMKQQEEDIDRKMEESFESFKTHNHPL